MTERRKTLLMIEVGLRFRLHQRLAGWVGASDGEGITLYASRLSQPSQSEMVDY
jgi:hypothetical protein